MILGLTPGQALKGSLAFVPLVCISDIVTKVLVPVDVIGVACVRQPSLSDPWVIACGSLRVLLSIYLWLFNMQILPCMAVIGDHRKETSTAHFADL